MTQKESPFGPGTETNPLAVLDRPLLLDCRYYYISRARTRDYGF